MQKRQPASVKKRPKDFETKTQSHKINRNRLKKSRILIIQEGNIIGELLSQLLLSKGCWVDTATSALEGLRKIKRRKFDLIFQKPLDVNKAVKKVFGILMAGD